MKDSLCRWSCSVPSAAASLDQICEDGYLAHKTDKVNRLSAFREDDATENSFEDCTERDICHLQLQTILEGSFLALRTVRTGVFLWGSLWIRRTLRCFHPIRTRNLQPSYFFGVPVYLEYQNIGTEATKPFGQGLEDIRFPASFFSTAHFRHSVIVILLAFFGLCLVATVDGLFLPEPAFTVHCTTLFELRIFYF